VVLSDEDIEFMRLNGIDTDSSGLQSSDQQAVIDDDVYILEPRFWAAFKIFCSLDTQWVWVGSMNGMHRTKLDGNAVIAYLRLRYKKKKALRLFDQIMEISRGALWGFNQ